MFAQFASKCNQKVAGVLNLLPYETADIDCLSCKKAGNNKQVEMGISSTMAHRNLIGQQL